MAYIHELSKWPEFTWDSHAIADPLAAARFGQGHLLGRMAGLGFELKREAQLTTLTDEIVKSWAIEGERLRREEVHSSIARRLGIPTAGLPEPGREVEGVVEMMLDATQHFSQPLTAERLHGWHAALFPTGMSGLRSITTGAWRRDGEGPMQVVSGPFGHERVHFQAPPAKLLEAEMGRFLDWFDTPPSVDPVLKAGVATFWFVTIHPYDDGNGRLTRAIAEMALARSDQEPARYYSMSTRIEKERSNYYLQLESAQRGSLDITSWLVWFLGCLDRAVRTSEDTLSAVLHKADLWQNYGDALNQRQRRVIGRMLEPEWQGHMHTAKYAKLTRCSADTALRDISQLLELGILARNRGKGRSTSYRLAGRFSRD